VASSGASSGASAGVVAAGVAGQGLAGRAPGLLAAGGFSSRKLSASSSVGTAGSGAAEAAVLASAGNPGLALTGGASAVWLARGAVGHVLAAVVTGVVAVVPDGALLAAGGATGRVAADACGPSAVMRAAAAPRAVVGAGRSAAGDACAVPLAADCGVAAWRADRTAVVSRPAADVLSVGGPADVVSGGLTAWAGAVVACGAAVVASACSSGASGSASTAMVTGGGATGGALAVGGTGPGSTVVGASGRVRGARARGGVLAAGFGRVLATVAASAAASAGVPPAAVFRVLPAGVVLDRPREGGGPASAAGAAFPLPSAAAVRVPLVDPPAGRPPDAGVFARGLAAVVFGRPSDAVPFAELTSPRPEGRGVLALTGWGSWFTDGRLPALRAGRSYTIPAGCHGQPGRQ